MTNGMGSTHERPVCVTSKLGTVVTGTPFFANSLDLSRTVFPPNSTHELRLQRESKGLKFSCLSKYEQDTSVIKDNKLR